MPPLTPEQADEVRRSKEELVALLFPADAEPSVTDVEVTTISTTQVPSGGNVVGVGYGAKVTGGRRTGATSLRVYVRTKRPRAQVADGELVPTQVGSLPTDVVGVGEVRLRQRPVRGGASIGHPDVTAGTLGCLVDLDDDEAPHILSNNHVLADVNRAEIGDPILEPGPSDGGTEPIAELTDFEPIVPGGEANAIDAAVAKVLDPADVEPQVEGIGAIQEAPADAVLDARVRKGGRTTGVTDGLVVDISTDLWVQVLPQTSAWFTDQIGVVGPVADFSQPGDSGSVVVDAESRAPIGLLFAGGEDLTFVNPIGPVLDRFAARIVAGSGS